MSEHRADNSLGESTERVLDMGVVEALKELGGGDDPDLFKDLVETFVEDSPARVRAIEAAAQNADAEQLSSAAHGLKSSAANMGAMRLSEICRCLEMAGITENLEGVDGRVMSLTREYAAAEKALRDACP